jgi:hypothetical protein
MVLLLNKGFESIELIGPELLMVLEPGRRICKGLGFELQPEAPPVFRRADFSDQSGRFEHVDVFGDAGERHAKGLRQLGDAQAFFAELGQHPAPGTICEGRENAIEAIFRFAILLNHLVE